MERTLIAVAIMGLLICVGSGCGSAPETGGRQLKVGMILNTGGEKDHGYNEYSLQGAAGAAEAAGIEFEYIVSRVKRDYDDNITRMVKAGADLIFTVGFDLARATARAANAYPDTRFVIIDYAYYPGSGCPEGVDSCYTQAGGLANVTSLVFKEDQPAFLAGALAACMSQTQVIGTVAGEKIPPVVRLVTGFENGARSVNPDIISKKIYIPDFNDPETGRKQGRRFIHSGADILFCPAGTTGLGGLGPPGRPELWPWGWMWINT